MEVLERAISFSLLIIRRMRWGRIDREIQIGPPGEHDEPPGEHDEPPGEHDEPPGEHDQPPGEHKASPLLWTSLGSRFIRRHSRGDAFSPWGPSLKLVRMGQPLRLPWGWARDLAFHNHRHTLATTDTQCCQTIVGTTALHLVEQG